jgi:hypothetical protein
MTALHPTVADNIPNGPAAAAILAAGIGCLALGVFALAGDASTAINHFFSFYKPSGALSGVSTMAVIVWLVAWFALARRWNHASVALAKVKSRCLRHADWGLAADLPALHGLDPGQIGRWRPNRGRQSSQVCLPREQGFAGNFASGCPRAAGSLRRRRCRFANPSSTPPDLD